MRDATFCRFISDHIKEIDLYSGFHMKYTAHDCNSSSTEICRRGNIYYQNSFTSIITEICLVMNSRKNGNCPANPNPGPVSLSQFYSLVFEMLPISVIGK